MNTTKGNKHFDFLTKVLILGDSGVGKSCLLLRFCDNDFTTAHLATIGVDYKMKIIDVEGKKVKAQLWDTAGQDRFQAITHTFYKGAQGIILAYAVNDRESFEHIERWMKQIKEHANEDVCMILVGNKTDMADRCIETEEGKKLAESYGIKFFETSAEKAWNVNDAFYEIVKEIKDKNPQSGSNSPGKDDKIKLSDENKPTGQSSRCC